MNREKIDRCVELLSLRGCTAVYEFIHALEQGISLPETVELADDEREAVLSELKSIMAVYAARKSPPC